MYKVHFDVYEFSTTSSPFSLSLTSPVVIFVRSRSKARLVSFIVLSFFLCLLESGKLLFTLLAIVPDVLAALAITQIPMTVASATGAIVSPFATGAFAIRAQLHAHP
jgi:hypothetical protein